MNKTDFLEVDLPIAVKHYTCCLYCLKSVGFYLSNGDLELAEKRLEDFEKSLDELKRLKEKKYRNDQLKEVVSGLVKKGILVDMVAFKRG